MREVLTTLTSEDRLRIVDISERCNTIMGVLGGIVAMCETSASPIHRRVGIVVAAAVEEAFNAMLEEIPEEKETEAAFCVEHSDG